RIMPLDEEIGPYTEDYYNRIMKNVVSYINSNMPAFKRIGRANNNGVIFTELQKYISGTIKSHLEKIRLQNVEFSVPPEVIAEFYSSAIVFLGKWWVENGLIYSEAEIALYIHKLLHGEYYVNHNE
ncbi:MAG TPA: TetR-like C-terminal domain-containing protein, partial [Eubacteriales bacterium]|nr:TetR-like C-terminal domain-containing protein [Eubacteriales bacterium]